MSSDAIETEHHVHHGWPIRVTCEARPDGQYAAHGFVTPGGQRERETPGPAIAAASPGDAKTLALKATKRYIDGMLVD